ncbi:MAG: sulfite exporter TauE/SafE family protein [Lachnospiraceae bacterium]
MEWMIYYLVALLASAIGSISGIGGGIIIKPVLDSIGLMPVATISFLSGCTVLAMAVSNFINNLNSSEKPDYRVSIFLALGASAGGCIGKQVFSMVKENLGLIQAVILLAINLFVLVYLWKKKNIHTHRINNPVFCVGIGLGLGCLSAFLGIGGGPVNIAVLSYFFSMESKETARNSLFIILFSQSTSLAMTFITHTIPEFSWLLLLIMCLGGIAGARIGGAVSKRMNNSTVDKLFLGLLVALISVNIYNLIKYCQP